MRKPDIQVSIIIVTNNHKQYLSACLDSIKKQTLKEYEVILVDNLSVDGTVEFVKKKYPFVHIIVGNKKAGFAANNNVALRICRGKYSLLLNPDTVLPINTISVLCKFMETHPRVGICGPKLIFPDGSLQYSARKFPTIWTGIVRRSPMRKWLQHSKINESHMNYLMDHKKAQPVDWMLGACLFIRKELFEDLGLLDERFFLYLEDIDYCLRAWRSAWEVWYVPQVNVTHFHQAESDKMLLSKQSYYHLMSMLRFFLKYRSRFVN